jgi:hypothetical protein
VNDTAGLHLLEFDREIHSFERAMAETVEKFSLHASEPT